MKPCDLFGPRSKIPYEVNTQLKHIVFDEYNGETVRVTSAHTYLMNLPRLQPPVRAEPGELKKSLFFLHGGGSYV